MLRIEIKSRILEESTPSFNLITYHDQQRGIAEHTSTIGSEFLHKQIASTLTFLDKRSQITTQRNLTMSYNEQ